MTRRRASSGFSLVEMVVAVAILGIVIAGVMETFVVQNRAYTVVDETTEAQQNLRAISYLIERDLRSTGFMVEGATQAVQLARGPRWVLMLLAKRLALS